MAVTAELQSLVDQMPNPNGQGMYTEDIDAAKINKAVAEIAQGGKESILQLINLLDAPGSAADAKPHYALHCVVNHSLVTRDEKLRREQCEALASQLNNVDLHPVNRAYLCQELQWAGREEACTALGTVLLDADVTDAAATALVAIGSESAAAQLRAAAGKATGKARLNILDALAALADPPSAEVFQKALADDDREVRIAAAAGLANIAQADAADALLKLADAATGWERTQITKSCLVLAETIAAQDKTTAKRIYERLQKSRTSDAEIHIRDAAARGLAAIS